MSGSLVPAIRMVIVTAAPRVVRVWNAFLQLCSNLKVPVSRFASVAASPGPVFLWAVAGTTPDAASQSGVVEYASGVRRRSDRLLGKLQTSGRGDLRTRRKPTG